MVYTIIAVIVVIVFIYFLKINNYKISLINENNNDDNK